jgi:hypothetical protein
MDDAHLHIDSLTSLASDPSVGGLAAAAFSADGGPSADNTTWSITVVLMATVLTLIIINILWPTGAASKLELLWTVAPREAERRRIWRLILPSEALVFNEVKSPQAAPQERSVVKRVSERLDVARLLSPDGRKSQQQWEHHWTFRPQTESARDRTPLLVFINRASGGRQGEATLVHLRALLSPQQVGACARPRARDGARSPQPAARSPQPAARSPQPAARSSQHAAPSAEAHGRAPRGCTRARRRRPSLPSASL